MSKQEGQEDDDADEQRELRRQDVGEVGLDGGGPPTRTVKPVPACRFRYDVVAESSPTADDVCDAWGLVDG